MTTENNNSISQILFQTLKKNEISSDGQSSSYLNKSLCQVFGFDPKIQTLFSQNDKKNQEVKLITNKRKSEVDEELSDNYDQRPSKIQKQQNVKELSSHLVKNINEDVEKTAETAQRETSRSLPRISTPDEVTERRRRTLFVGNLPLSCKKNQLKQIFKKYGRVEKIWFRNIAYTHPGRPKKISWIKKDFHPDLQTMTAFILFDSRENARKALVEHNTVLSGHHIRVDLAEPDKKTHDTKNCIFVGNLPLSTEEESLRQHFESCCGQVDYVRVIRDAHYKVCKGFGYVKFKVNFDILFAIHEQFEEDYFFGGNNVYGR